MIIVTERKLNIPRSDLVVGCAGDNLVEIRNFELSRFYGDIDMSLFDFKLDTQVGTVKNIIDLSKVVAEETITLTWTIDESHILYSGYMAIQVRAFHGEVEKWHSAQEHVLVMPSINPAAAQPDILPSEFEQMEQRVTAAKIQAQEAAQTTTEQANRAQGIADTFSNTTLPVAISEVEAAGQAKVDLAEEQAVIAAEKAREASDSATSAAATIESKVDKESGKSLAADTVIYEVQTAPWSGVIYNGADVATDFDPWTVNHYYVIAAADLAVTLSATKGGAQVGESFIFPAGAALPAVGTTVDFIDDGGKRKLRPHGLNTITLDVPAALQGKDIEIDYDFSLSALGTGNLLYFRAVPYNTFNFKTVSDFNTYYGANGVVFAGVAPAEKKYMRESGSIRLIKDSCGITVAVNRRAVYASDIPLGSGSYMGSNQTSYAVAAPTAGRIISVNPGRYAFNSPITAVEINPKNDSLLKIANGSRYYVRSVQ